MKKNRIQAAALIPALIIIMVLSAAIGIAVDVTNTTMHLTDASRDFSALRSASEGALDFAYGIWTKTVNGTYHAVTTAEVTANLAITPTFPGFSYASASLNGPLKITAVDAYGTPTANPVGVNVNLDAYPGWVGKNYSYVASVRMSGTFVGNRTVTYGAKRNVNYSTIPLFQATAFMEGDMELYKTATMTISGLLHTNSEAYVSSNANGSNSLTITGYLSYVTDYLDSDAPPYANTWSGYSTNAAFEPNYTTSKSAQVHQVSRMEPLGTDTMSELDTTDSNPNNDSLRELIEPPNNSYSDPPEISQRRFFNKAGIIIRTAGSTTVTTQNGTTLTSAQTTALKNAISKQTIYDRREGKNVDVSTLDLSAAKATLNAASGFNGVLYIDDTSSTGYNDPKAIRLKNGGVLPSDGLTIASQNPVYIQGDYNTGTTSSYTAVPSNYNGNPSNTDSPVVPGYTEVPAAVIGDAVTILSNAWNDSNSSKALSSRVATHTTVNTAIACGSIPSGWVNEYGDQYGYSGGLNNFPRFLEDWGSKSFTYYGSLVQLFTSQIATGEWDTGNIYNPPNRCWNYESTFTNNPPPGSLDAVAINRGSIVRF